MFEIEFVPSAAKDFRALQADLSLRIIRAFDRIKAEPEVGKPLQGPYRGLRSYRVGDWRIVYRIDADSKIVLIYRIGHRRDVYRS